MDADPSRRRAALLFLAAGTLAFGFAPILARVCRYPAAAVAALRLLAAGLLLLPFAAAAAARWLKAGGWPALLRVALPALLLGLHFQFWVLGIRATSVATGTFIVSVNPVVFALAERLIDRRRIPPRTAAALLLVLSGALWILLREGGRIGRVGDLFCFLSVLFFVAYLMVSRDAARGVPHRVYIQVLYLAGGLLTLPFVALAPVGASAAARLPAPPLLTDTGSLLALLGLALFPTLVGHTSTNYGVRFFSPLTVSFFTLLEPVFATAAAAPLLGEPPRTEVLPAYALFVAATVLVLTSGRRRGSCRTR